MTNSLYHGLFLDDRENERCIIDQLNSGNNSYLSMHFMLANASLEKMADIVIDKHPDLLALDYRLDDVQGASNVEMRYKAGPLAQQLRDRASEEPKSDFPIVLISNENNIKRYYQSDLTVHDLFDGIYLKGRLVSDDNKVTQELLALVEAYKAIIDSLTDGSPLSRLLGLNEPDEAEEVLNHQELRQWQQLKIPHQLARKILQFIIRSNGLLLDNNYLFAILGIDPDSKDKNRLFEILADEDITYRGIFFQGWQRWWSYRLDTLGKCVCSQDLGNLTAQQRTQCLNQRYGLSLQAARSKWTGSDDMFPGCACASCDYPTEKIHSVVVFERVPSFVEQQRVCWDCVAKGEYENKNISLDDAEDYIVSKIKNGEIQR